MSMCKLQLLAYAVFLILYAAQKYLAADPGTFVPQYVFTTAILVVLTGVIPFFVGRFVFDRTGSGIGVASIASLLVPLVLTAIGLAIYFFMFIAPQNLGLSVMDVLPRSLTPGLVQGALLAIGFFDARKA